jgi:hypothetical protein
MAGPIPLKARAATEAGSSVTAGEAQRGHAARPPDRGLCPGRRRMAPLHGAVHRPLRPSQGSGSWGARQIPLGLQLVSSVLFVSMLFAAPARLGPWPAGPVHRCTAAGARR